MEPFRRLLARLLIQGLVVSEDMPAASQPRSVRRKLGSSQVAELTSLCSPFYPN